MTKRTSTTISGYLVHCSTGGDMSPHMGTLVSEQGIDAAFRLIWKGSAICPDSYSRPLAFRQLGETLRFTSLGQGDST